MEILAENLSFLGSVYNVSSLTLGLLLLAAWDTVWKAVALWRAARMRMVWWFIALLTTSSAGILPIIFIFFMKGSYKTLIAKEKKTLPEPARW